MEKYFELVNGVKIPAIGFGTWKTPDGDAAEEAVSFALNNGYRHIDGAAMYKNEAGVGRGIRVSGVPREEIFVTSKVWNTERGYDKARRAFERTLEGLGLDYLDLYLIHWPASRNQFPNADELNLETWRALTDLYKEGRVRAIGVSNFKPHHLEPLMETEVPPMVDQIEYHPGFLQDETVDFCREHGIQVEAWSPLGRGHVLADDRMQSIAARYGKSPAQVCVRFALQNGVVPLPKSVTKERILENLDVFDFEISDDDMAQIAAMTDLGGSGHDPDTIDF